MKRMLYIALLIAMLLPGKGMALFQHFCGGELISFELFHKYTEPCCDDHSNPCDGCEDRETVFFLDDFRAPQSDFQVPSFALVGLPEPIFSFSNKYICEPTNFSSLENAPPGWSGRYRSILFQSFLL
ncbi:hypothetical protein QWY31_16200 [Cytophagales bacterium LB-30]|uniref:Secreted protein n=1 Tax=Shiella aurantiaca TaxID=3058365 RepID=A0ABT8F9X5_9BACT|nr:hypothetical protein [Shiella aurantiaca]MDN4167054.1 hypothetical protein [Shiella aurantiaca]